MKQLADYTAEELQEIGRKEVQRRIAYAKVEAEKRAVMGKLYQAWKDGKVKI